MRNTITMEGVSALYDYTMDVLNGDGLKMEQLYEGIIKNLCNVNYKHY